MEAGTAVAQVAPDANARKRVTRRTGRYAIFQGQVWAILQPAVDRPPSDGLRRPT